MGVVDEEVLMPRQSPVNVETDGFSLLGNVCEVFASR